MDEKCARQPHIQRKRDTIKKAMVLKAQNQILVYEMMSLFFETFQTE